MQTIKFCKTKRCCPEVNVVKENGEVSFVIGGKEEGVTVFTRNNFKDFIAAAKEGVFDEFVR
jgi:hypothetical protein